MKRIYFELIIMMRYKFHNYLFLFIYFVLYNDLNEIYQRIYVVHKQLEQMIIISI